MRAVTWSRDTRGTTSTTPFRPSACRSSRRASTRSSRGRSSSPSRTCWATGSPTTSTQGALYVRPVPAAGALSDALRRLRTPDAALDGALTRPGDDRGRLGRPHGLPGGERGGVGGAPGAPSSGSAASDPEFELRVVDVLRPGDGRAQTDYLLSGVHPRRRCSGRSATRSRCRRGAV